MVRFLPALLLTCTVAFSPKTLAQTDSPPASQPASQPTSAPTEPEEPERDPLPASTCAAGPEDESAELGPVESPPAKTAGADATPEPPIEDSAGWTGDFDAGVLVVRRGAFTLRMGGLIQVQGAFYVGDEAAIQFQDPANNEGFRIRRARFGFSGQLLPDVGYYLAVDLKDTVAAATGGTDYGNEILDATITWNRYKIIRIAAGVDRVPFSTFAMMSSGKLTIIERPLTVRLLDPDRRVGARVFGQIGSLDYAAGVFNGQGSGITSGNSLGGIGASVRLAYHLLGRRNSFVPRDFGIELAGGYVYDNGDTTNLDRISAALQLQGYRTRLVAEFLWQRSTPDAEPTGEPDAGVATRWGAAAELSVFVWREYVQLAARYEYFRDNEQLPVFGRQQLISGGLNIYLCRHRFKLQANYQRRDERTGPTVPNDIAFAQLQAMF